MRTIEAKPVVVSRWRHWRAIVLLPVMNVVAIPAAILLATGFPNLPQPGAVDAGEAAMLTAGAVALVGGAMLIVSSIRLFMRRGRGTLAPWDPPRILVTEGVYGYCRNPMKAGLIATQLGEALLFGSVPLLLWLICFASVNVAYVRWSEEPALRARFGFGYAEYCRTVPRWLPRLVPWRAADAAGRDRP